MAHVPIALLAMVGVFAPVLLAAQGIERVSLGDRDQGNSESFSPLISAKGGVVVFTSSADNLVPGDTNERRDAFVLELK